MTDAWTGLLSNECWLLGAHDRCTSAEWCACLCHEPLVDWDLDMEGIE